MSVQRAQAEISGNEFAEWLAYMEIEPFGGERGDLRSAIVASTIANIFRPKGARLTHPEDFMPDFCGMRGKAKRLTAQNWRSQRSGMKAMLMAMGNRGEG